MRIWDLLTLDPEWKNLGPGSGINKEYPGSATLFLTIQVAHFYSSLPSLSGWEEEGLSWSRQGLHDGVHRVLETQV
jgi:hypothetical protein